MSRIESLKMRPYARLITMLGDQLIKDEIIALIELVKNAYDADAEHVKISFQYFNTDYTSSDQSIIVIEDDGNGMNDVILKESWMNPATPEKLKKKRNKGTTDKGRIMQGEKGIGRFAIFKLGRNTEIVTRRQKQIKGHFIDLPETDKEYVLDYDFANYDTDFLKEGGEEKEIYLDDLIIRLETRAAEEIISAPVIYNGTIAERKPYGTKITVSFLNSEWNRNKIAKVYQSIIRMQPIFEEEFIPDFLVSVDINGDTYISKEKGTDEIRHILEEKAVLTVDGSFDADTKTISFTIISYKGFEEHKYKVFDHEMQGISQMKEFINALSTREAECGSFSFKFYIFDMDITARDPDTRFYLDPEEKKSIKAHRVYLYRDGIRVMPYGDPEDDWLNLDTIRGIESAGHIFGNDQIVGYIKISQKDNPRLRDKTNREGLVEDGYAREDLVNICQLVLRFIRTKNYSRYLIEKREKKKKREEAQNKPLSLITKAREEELGSKVVDEVLRRAGVLRVKDIPSEDIAAGQKVIDRFLDELEQAYRKQVDVFESQIFTTENLAAIGLSAETAYHDARIIISEVNNTLGSILDNYKKQKGSDLDKDSVLKDLNPIKNQMAIVARLMKHIQRLFPSTKNKKTSINVQQIAGMVKNLYSKSLLNANIGCAINNCSSQALLVECTDAVLLQVFINLFDNALYWLKTVGGQRRILIEIDTIQRTVLFADSGPGVDADDEPYIFEAFYSGKGEEGKGLGLYIARQLLERYNYSISLVTDNQIKRLNGANFVLRFNNEEK